MDANKLIYEIKSRGYSVRDVAEKIGIGYSTFYKKMNGRSEFTVSEIEAIIGFLGIETPVGIFFANKVS